MRRRLLAWLLCWVMLCTAAPARAIDEEEYAAIVDEVLTVAAQELGYTRARSGYTKYADWAESNKYGEWCSEFVSWCVNQADQRLGTYYLDYLFPMQASCNAGVNWYTARGRYVTVKGNIADWGTQWYRADGVPVAERLYVPQRGDLVYFEWYKYNRIDHVGIVEYVTQDAQGGYTIHTIEGNGWNTDSVARFSYPLEDERIRAYGVHLNVVGTQMRSGDKGPVVQAFQQALADAGYADTRTDGTYDASTVAAVRQLQAALGLEQTGVADQAVQEALQFAGVE